MLLLLLLPVLPIIKTLSNRFRLGFAFAKMLFHVSSGSDRQHLVSETRGPTNDHYQVSWNLKVTITLKKKTTTDLFSPTASEERWPERYIWWTRPQKINGRKLTGVLSWKLESPHRSNICWRGKSGTCFQKLHLAKLFPIPNAGLYFQHACKMML